MIFVLRPDQNLKVCIGFAKQSALQLSCSWICSPSKKVPSSRFAGAFVAPKMLEIGLPRLRMSRRFVQNLSRAVSRFSRGPVARNHRQHFLNQTGSNTIANVHRIETKRFFPIRSGNVVVLEISLIETVLTAISCNWAPRSGKQLWIDIGESSD